MAFISKTWMGPCVAAPSVDIQNGVGVIVNCSQEAIGLELTLLCIICACKPHLTHLYQLCVRERSGGTHDCSD